MKLFHVMSARWGW